MRLIDADALKKSIPSEEIASRMAIMNAPTIEPKKGKWQQTDDGWEGIYYVCSECGCPWTLIEGSPKDNGMNFCPNCGARMENSEEA